jgi:hypothetical protein
VTENHQESDDEDDDAIGTEGNYVDEEEEYKSANLI